jgi:hypothetical protein
MGTRMKQRNRHYFPVMRSFCALRVKERLRDPVRRLSIGDFQCRNYPMGFDSVRYRRLNLENGPHALPDRLCPSCLELFIFAPVVLLHYLYAGTRRVRGK